VTESSGERGTAALFRRWIWRLAGGLTGAEGVAVDFQSAAIEIGAEGPDGLCAEDVENLVTFHDH
jgi:hypothetical protein